jgi:hypothetical protein
MKFHVMRREFHSDQGKVVFICTMCSRCVEIDSEGELAIIRRGDPRAIHRGGLALSTEPAIDQPPPPVVH